MISNYPKTVVEGSINVLATVLWNPDVSELFPPWEEFWWYKAHNIEWERRTKGGGQVRSHLLRCLDTLATFFKYLYKRENLLWLPLLFPDRQAPSEKGPTKNGSNLLPMPPSVARLDALPTGDQEVAGSTPAEVGNILSWRLIMKYFLWSFSLFRWFNNGSCQFLAKECAQYWLTA